MFIYIVQSDVNTHLTVYVLSDNNVTIQFNSNKLF